MTQENQGTGSAVPDNLPAKRKRGRPRKDRSQTQGQVPAAPNQTPGQVPVTPSQTPGQVPVTPSQTQGQVLAIPTPEIEKKNQRQKIDAATDAKSDMVGQAVFGILDGSFDAGYLLTVRVGETNTILKGVVFQPGSSVPVSGSNDVAPHMKMMKRAEVNIPQVDVITPGQSPCVQSVQFNKRPDLSPGRSESFHHSRGTPPANTVPRVPPQPFSQSQSQIIQGVQNNTVFASEVVTSTLPQAEVKAKNSADTPVDGHSGNFHIQVCSHGKDFQKSQPNDILPDHPQPELKDKPASPTKSSKLEYGIGETVKQATSLETEAPGGGEESLKSEPSTKNMLDLLRPSEDQPGAALGCHTSGAAAPHMTAEPTAETIKILQENQTPRI